MARIAAVRSDRAVVGACQLRRAERVDLVQRYLPAGHGPRRPLLPMALVLSGIESTVVETHIMSAPRALLAGSSR
jgi:hypothetical protein